LKQESSSEHDVHKGKGKAVDDSTPSLGQTVDDPTPSLGQAVDDSTPSLGQAVDDSAPSLEQAIDDSTPSLGQAVDGFTPWLNVGANTAAVAVGPSSSELGQAVDDSTPSLGQAADDFTPWLDVGANKAAMAVGPSSSDKNHYHSDIANDLGAASTACIRKVDKGKGRAIDPPQDIDPPKEVKEKEEVKEKRFLGILFKGKIPQISGLREDVGVDVKTALPKKRTESDSQMGSVPITTDSLPKQTSGAKSPKHTSPGLPTEPVDPAREKRSLGMLSKDKGPQGITRKREDEGSDADTERAPPKKRTKSDDQVGVSFIAAKNYLN
jgi:hypothetical protein